MKTTARATAFTLLELLTTIAIIATLAAIAIPNFLHSQVRAKIARTKMDIAALDAGLRVYFSEHNAYPPNNETMRRALARPVDDWTRVAVDERDRKFADSLLWRDLGDSGEDLWRLTTPVAYIGHQLSRVDPFGRPGPTSRHAYFIYVNGRDARTSAALGGATAFESEPLRRFLLASRGPDLAWNFDHPAFGPWRPYNLLNGTASDGDILDLDALGLATGPLE